MTFDIEYRVLHADGEGDAASKLTSYPWEWVAFTNPVERFDVETPESYQIAFNRDGTVAIESDCNSASGSYTVDGSSLTIEVGPATMAACPGESRGEQFVAYLEGAAIYFFEAGNLYIDVGSDKNQPVDADTLQQRVGAVLRQQPKTQILVRGDRDVDYGRVVEAMVLLQEAGAPGIGLITEPPEG